MNAWAPGAIVDGYRLLERLGSGGMGEVWKVEHLSTGVLRALKTVRSREPEILQRFVREARSLATLSHANVARVHSMGNAHGVPYMVLDLGQSDLAQRLAAGPLDPAAARSLVRDLARGLDHVHKHGLLHRDLKPSNVIFDEQGRPQLIDFGLVRKIDGSSLTQSGALLGTPKYMAPEQVDASRELDARADVYGLGALLYHALTGQPPFTQTSLALFRAILERRPSSPSKLNPHVPKDLAQTCMRALEKDPAKRFASAADLAAALDGPEPTTRQLERWLTLATACAVLALAGLGGIALRTALRSPRDARDASEPAPSRSRSKALPERSTGAPSHTSTASSSEAPLTHPLDDVLSAKAGTFEKSSLKEFGWQASAFGSLDSLLEGRNVSGLGKAHDFLCDQERYQEAVALLYCVARNGLALKDPQLRARSQRAWIKLGSDLLGDEAIRGEFWTPTEWSRHGADVLETCFERAARFRHAQASVCLGDLYRVFYDGAGLSKDPERAQQAYTRALRDKPQNTDTHVHAQAGLAILAWEYPSLAGRLTDREACDVLEDLVLTEYGKGRDLAVPLAHVLESLKARLMRDAGVALDSTLSTLPEVTRDDLEGFTSRVPGMGTPAELLDLSNTNAFEATYLWLHETGHPIKAVALLYQVATRSKALPLGEARLLGQRGWYFLGEQFRHNACGLRAVWPDETWAALGRELVVECYLRAMQGGRAEAALALGTIYLGEDPFQKEFGFDLNPLVAQAHFRTALKSLAFDNEDLNLAKLSLAEIALDYPDTPGRLPDDEALLTISRVLESLPSSARLKHTRATRIANGLQERISASKTGE